MKYKVALTIPTRNAGDLWKLVLQSIDQQQISLDIKLLIDTTSTDQTIKLARNYGFTVISILPHEFNHGRTRSFALDYIGNADIVIFMTQDAILAEPTALQKLISSFDDPSVAVAYGRQLPHENATIFARHLRLFNYPEYSRIISREDIPRLGIRAPFCSNSFAAYRVSALNAIGRFPDNTIMGEDVCAAARMLLKGWKIYYNAEACVFHSHNYSLIEEFKRYFDIGVFHSRQKWLHQNFGKADSEGFKYLISEAKYVIRNNILLIPFWGCRILAKLVGYKLGLYERWIPKRLKTMISMHKRYWMEKTNS
ncbi:glycosyltransferase family 2 protein [Thermosynechococcus sp. FA-CM-4201]